MQVVKGTTALTALLGEGGNGPAEGQLPVELIFQVMRDSERPPQADVPLTGKPLDGVICGHSRDPQLLPLRHNQGGRLISGASCLQHCGLQCVATEDGIAGPLTCYTGRVLASDIDVLIST